MADRIFHFRIEFCVDNAALIICCDNNNINKSTESNLGTGPRRGAVGHGEETRWANVAWRSFMNMAKLNWLS